MTIAAVTQGAARALLAFALPRVCCACERPMDAHETGMVCGRCWARLPLLPHPQCARCGHPLRGKCGWCAILPPYVRAVRSVCWVDHGTGLEVVHALKYDGWHAAAVEMAERMARLRWPEDVAVERSAVVPVPLAPARERERGYNQSALLARSLARAWGIPMREDWLLRTRATRTQTRLTPDQRKANVFGAIRASDSARAATGLHVVLVDDVVTTAATLNACATALLDAGARIVSYATFGRAPASGDRR